MNGAAADTAAWITISSNVVRSLSQQELAEKLGAIVLNRLFSSPQVDEKCTTEEKYCNRIKIDRNDSFLSQIYVKCRTGQKKVNPKKISSI